MRYIAFLILIVFVSLCSLSDVKAIDNVRDTTKNFRVTAFPLIYFLPESGFGFGGASIATFRFKGAPKESRPSTFQLGATYTQKKQILLFLPYELYFKNEEYRLVGELGYYKYFYNYYGIGAKSSEDDLELYDVTFPRFRATMLKKIRQNLSLGFTLQYDHMDITKIKEDGLLERNTPTGYQGGVLGNIGLQVLFDTRDNIFYPYKGSYIQLDILNGSKGLVSDFNYQKLILDVRHFIQIKKATAIGFQFFTGAIVGQAPFFDLFYFGTPLIGRGIADRRFIDRNMYAFQSELRFPIYKRFGGVVFATLNSVSNSFLQFSEANFIPTIGAGLRYNVNKKERNQVRIDVGYGSEGVNFYATASNAF